MFCDDALLSSIQNHSLSFSARNHFPWDFLSASDATTDEAHDLAKSLSFEKLTEFSNKMYKRIGELLTR